MFDTIYGVAVECWLVLGQMAPYLLLGFLVAGVLSVGVSPRYIERHLGGNGYGAIFKAAIFGIPLPLCSCGVIPVSASLRRHGASRAATASFLLSTPQTGVDSIAVTYAMLGPVFAIYRPVVALLTGFLGGMLVRLLGESESQSETTADHDPQVQSASGSDTDESHVLIRILKYGFVTLPRDISVALIIGVLVAGALSALIPPDQLKPYVGGGVLAVLLLMAAGIPIYVCATASVPLAAAFMHLGASPGAALAFLITGPATNAAAFTTIWKVLGRRTALVYLGAVALAAILAGLTLDWLFPNMTCRMTDHSAHDHAAAGGSLIAHSSAVLLSAVLLWSYFSSRRSATPAAPVSQESGASPRDGCRQILYVTGMHCSHCVESVRRALMEVAGVRAVEIESTAGPVTVHGAGLDRDALRQVVLGLGYSVRELDNSAS